MKKSLEENNDFKSDINMIVNTDFEDLLAKEDDYKKKLSIVFSDDNKFLFNENPSEALWDEAEERFKLDGEAINTFINTTKIDSFLKKVYAWVLLGLLVFQLLAVNVIFILSGFGILKYTETTFNIFIGGALIEVILLVAVVVKYLFKDNISSSLKTILEKNRKKENS